MKKRLMALACVAVLTLGMSMTALATNPSVQAGIVSGVDKVVDKNNNAIGGEGSSVKLIVEDIHDTHEHAPEEDYIREDANVKKELDNLKVEIKADEKAQVLDVRNVELETTGNVNAADLFPITITFKVNGIKAGDKVILLHYVSDAKGWEKLDTITGNGTVTATFNSLSPVAFIKLADAKAPSTGEPVSLMLAGAVVALGTVGTVVSKKRK